MSERFVFADHPTLAGLEAKAASPEGQMAIAEIQGRFQSLAGVLRHTSDNLMGNAVIHLGHGEHITFVNVSTTDLAASVRPYAAIIDRLLF